MPGKSTTPVFLTICGVPVKTKSIKVEVVSVTLVGFSITCVRAKGSTTFELKKFKAGVFFLDGPH